MLSAGKIESWQACKADAIKRDSFWPRRQQFLQTLPEEERERLSMLSSEARDDTKGEVPGTERSDEEERLFQVTQLTLIPGVCTVSGQDMHRCSTLDSQ